MSNYFTVKGLKVRISDHEPNYSMDRIRGIATFAGIGLAVVKGWIE